MHSFGTIGLCGGYYALETAAACDGKRAGVSSVFMWISWMEVLSL